MKQACGLPRSIAIVKRWRRSRRVREQGRAAELLTIATDLTDDSAADAVSEATRGKFDRINILVNNAGIGPGAIRQDSWQRPLKF